MGLMIDKPAKTLFERFAQKQPGGHFACPRCGKMTMDAESVTHNALSRRIGCYICDTCGTVEALEDFAHKQNSLNVWAITKEPELWRMLSWNSDGIEIAGHEGTWYVIDEGDFQITPDVDGKPETLTAHLFLLESELYGEDAAGLIVNDEKQIVMEDVWNGFDDLEDAGWEKARKIECPVCKGEFLREDMTFTRDCHGITFRLVCFAATKRSWQKATTEHITPKRMNVLRRTIEHEQRLDTRGAGSSQLRNESSRKHELRRVSCRTEADASLIGT